MYKIQCHCIGYITFCIVEVNCGDPGIGSNVSKIGNNHEYADIVIYRCAEQHVLTGGGLEELWIRCGSGGTWNGTAPSCERKYSSVM